MLKASTGPGNHLEIGASLGLVRKTGGRAGELADVKF
jgi:hypothetical protein